MKPKIFGSMVIIVAAGCLPLDLVMPGKQETEKVPSDPFQTAVLTPPKSSPPWTVNYPEASTEVSAWVDFVGRKIIKENQQIGVRPLFATIGSPTSEIFHKDTSFVYVTSGLVKQCKSESQLAAMLSLELGRLVAERESRVNYSAMGQEPPPSGITIGQLLGFGKKEKDMPSQGHLPPDPQNLARTYLEKAGYPKTDLDAVLPILHEADKNSTFEKQMRGTPSGTTWGPGNGWK